MWWDGIYRKKSNEVRSSKMNGTWKKTSEEIGACSGNTSANRAWSVLKNMRAQNKDTARRSFLTRDQWTTCYRE